MLRTASQQGISKLYHYQPARQDYLRETLTSNRVRFSDPQDFNDPWDCHPYFVPKIDDEETRRKWGERLAPVYDSLPEEARNDIAQGTNGRWWNHKGFLRKVIEELTLETGARSLETGISSV